jgi:hypothetical protein
MHIRLKQALAGGALAGGLLAGGATVAWAQTSPSTPTTTLPSGSGSGSTQQAPPSGGMKGDCPNMGGSTGSGASTTAPAQTSGYQGV